MSRVKAKFTNETKQAILERDWYRCALCWSVEVQDIHHAYFNLESNVTESRNDIDQWLALCSECHNWCHSCKSGQWIRQEAINYLINYYEPKRNRNQ